MAPLLVFGAISPRMVGQSPLEEMTIVLDADVIRVITASGVTRLFPWATATCVVEDDMVLIIVIQTVSVPIPKRVLDEAMSALIRSRVEAR